MARKERRRRIRRGAKEWSALVAEQADSGLSQRAFCAARGVSLSSFCAARRRVGASSVPAPRVEDFVALPMGSMTMAGWGLELDLGEGVVLRLRRA